MGLLADLRGGNLTFLPMHLTGLLGMPRCVFIYPGDLGWNTLNLIASVGAFIIAAGFLVFTYDLLRPGKPRLQTRKPCNAGTLECSDTPSDDDWGVRSIPYITSRYPLWDQPRLVDRMAAGCYYLSGAPYDQRETLVTSVIDARPFQVQRVTGDAWITLLAAGFIGGCFILPTLHLYVRRVISGLLGVACILYWLWTSTARIPETEMKDAGLY